MPADTPAPLLDAPAARPAPARSSAGAGGVAFTPMYRQIQKLLTQDLEAGLWKPGAPIPSEQELAARFGVSQGTVRKAVDAMAAEHLLVRRQGRGTFVATHAEARVQYRFLRLKRDDGRSEPLARRLIDVERRRADGEVAQALALRSGAACVRIRRLLLDAAMAPAQPPRPVVLDEIWLPARRFPGLDAQRLANTRGPLYEYFETRFGISMLRADESLRAVAATGDGARLLEVAEGTPLLSVERLAYTYGDQPIEWRRGLYLTDHHHYRHALR